MRLAPVWHRLRRRWLNFVGDVQVAFEVVTHEAGAGVSPVVIVEVVHRPAVPGEEAVAERRIRHEANAQFAQQWQHLGLGIAGPQRVLGLQSRCRIHPVTDGTKNPAADED